MRFELSQIFRDDNRQSFNKSRPFTVSLVLATDEPENALYFDVSLKSLKTFRAFRWTVFELFAIWLDDPADSLLDWETLVGAAIEEGKHTQRMIRESDESRRRKAGMTPPEDDPERDDPDDDPDDRQSGSIMNRLMERGLN